MDLLVCFERLIQRLKKERENYYVLQELPIYEETKMDFSARVITSEIQGIV